MAELADAADSKSILRILSFPFLLQELASGTVFGQLARGSAICLGAGTGGIRVLPDSSNSQ
jgi:hypothetical protein